jgi:hypothetical protein
VLWFELILKKEGPQPLFLGYFSDGVSSENVYAWASGHDSLIYTKYWDDGVHLHTQLFIGWDEVSWTFAQASWPAWCNIIAVLCLSF